MPKLTGTPIESAMNEVTSVPTIGTSAPNFSVTGFHSRVDEEPEAELWMAGRLPYTSETMMPSRSASTRKAKKRATALKSRSWSWTLLASDRASWRR